MRFSKGWNVILSSVLLMASLPVASALAQEPGRAAAAGSPGGAEGPMQAHLSARKVWFKDGHDVFADAAEAKPGDIIEYRAVYANIGTATIRDVQGSLPVPDGTSYLEGSAWPARFAARLAAEPAFRPVPLTREHVDASGVVRTTLIPPSEYRALRWTLGELAPGRSKTVAARVRVAAGAPAPPLGTGSPSPARTSSGMATSASAGARIGEGAMPAQ